MVGFGQMKNSKPQISPAARAYLSQIGSTGGKAGSRADKRKAARARWKKHKPLSPVKAGE